MFTYVTITIPIYFNKMLYIFASAYTKYHDRYNKYFYNDARHALELCKD